MVEKPENQGRSTSQPAEGDDTLPEGGPGSPGKPAAQDGHSDRRSPLDPPGVGGGTAGTGGDNKVQDELNR